jgi:dolichol-phosphate mannosyltransferase
MNLISVVVPIFNEEETIPELVARLTKSVGNISTEYELIFIDDGSTDQSLNLLKTFAKENDHIKFISLSRNFGHQNAMMAGLQNSNAKTIVIMDGDLQDPPELIPALYKKLNEGYKIVYAKRANRKGESYFKLATAKLFYRILKRITAIDIPLDTGDFRIISAGVLKELLQMNESSKFLRGQISWLGFSQSYVNYERDERKFGQTKFSLKKMIRFAFDGITSFSNFPLQIATFLGFIFSIVAFIIVLYALYSKFILLEVVTGWTSLMVSSMFIGGVQLLCLGIIGEYISRISTDIKKRPLYIINESNVSEKN